MATLKDVAERAGVSIATVSNVITGAKPVSEAVCQQVRSAIAELHYVSSRAGKKSNAPEQKTIGVILTQFDSVFFPWVIQGIQKIALAQNYDVIFYPTNCSRTAEKRYMKKLIDSNVAGIILDTCVPREEVEYFRSLASLRNNSQPVPVVSIQEDLTGFGLSSISFDNLRGGYMATEHLIQKGCRNIVCIGGLVNAIWAHDRFAGYLKCLEDYGLPYNSSYYVNGFSTLMDGYSAANGFLANALEFDGIFAQSDLMAIGAIKLLQERGYAIPRDVKIVGYDNIFFTTMISPSLTTINIPKQRLGEEAARHLITRIEDPGFQDVVNVPLQQALIERQTTNPDMSGNWELFMY